MISWEGKNGCKNHFSPPQTVAEFLWGCSHLVPWGSWLGVSPGQPQPGSFVCSLSPWPPCQGHLGTGQVAPALERFPWAKPAWGTHPKFGISIQGRAGGGTGGSPSSCPCFNPRQESPKGTGTAQGDQCPVVLGFAQLFLIPISLPPFSSENHSTQTEEENPENFKNGTSS